MSKQHDITVIAGLSGVGKTYVIKELMHESSDYAHFSAGTLISKRMANLEHDHLRGFDKNGILTNQYLLVEQFREELGILDTKRRVLFDVHMLIDNNESIIEIPYEIFEKLSPTRLIFLFDDAEKIIGRRKTDMTRNRPLRSISEIKQHQEKSLNIAKDYSSQLAIKFSIFFPSDINSIVDFINKDAWNL